MRDHDGLADAAGEALASMPYFTASTHCLNSSRIG
jgi:hypothetical protein